LKAVATVDHMATVTRLKRVAFFWFGMELSGDVAGIREGRQKIHGIIPSGRPLTGGENCLSFLALGTCECQQGPKRRDA